MTLAQASSFFAHPALAAAGAVAISIPIIIHLLSRLRRRPLPWGAMRFVYEAFRRHRQRLRLEQLLLLLVRCLAIGLAGMALAGPILSGWAQRAGLGGSGRLVCLVIDDSLSTQALSAGGSDKGESRFETLRKQALRTLDGLDSGDRVAVWVSARPSRNLVPISAASAGDARRAIEGLKPRASRSDTVAALADVAAALEKPEAAGHSGRSFVVLISDLSPRSLPLDEPAPTEAARIKEHARLLLSRPALPVINTQIAQLTPRRFVVVASAPGAGAEAAVSLQLTLRRFTGTPTATNRVTVELLHSVTGKVVATTQRDHAWQSGQTEAMLQVDVPLTTELLTAGESSGSTLAGAVTLIARAGLEHDALAADDVRQGLIEVRGRLNVAVIDAQGAASDDSGLAPGRWLTLALSPQPVSAGVIDVVNLSPNNIDAQTVKGLDAAMVLRPDLLGDESWSALKAMAERGGVVWLFMPATEAPTAWAQGLIQRWNLPWETGLEPVSAPEGEFWQLATDAAPPEALKLLSSDWADLLRPIAVTRRLDVRAQSQAAGEGTESVWLRLAPAPGSGQEQGAPLLVSAPLGEGRVLLMASAIDVGWGNLPAKPLFVPLLHEGLRGVMGRSPESSRLAAVVSGDQPVLGPRFEAAQALVNTGEGESTTSLLLQRVDQGLRPVGALDEPGVYVTSPAPTARLSVNVDAEGGDTGTLDTQRLTDWLEPFGAWQWLDGDRPVAAMAMQTAAVPVGWHLLWIVLGLIVLEAALARWFSHARLERNPLGASGATALLNRGNAT